MSKLKDMHFEISERKVFLRITDLIVVLFSIWLLGLTTDFTYLRIEQSHTLYIVVLCLYIHFFGTLFELYNLQNSSSEVGVSKGVILTSVSTVVFYLLTPWYTPVLPSNRYQIILFFLALFISLYGWRYIYSRFLTTHRFYKKSLLFCNIDNFHELEQGLRLAHPYYRIVGIVNTASSATTAATMNVPVIRIEDVAAYCAINKISEITVGVYDSQEITPEISAHLLQLLEQGFIVREYAQVYENLTYRIPLQFLTRDFYRYFPFSRSNQNHLYLWMVRFNEIVFAILGLAFGLVLLPFVALGNWIGNKGPLLYTQDRIGQNGIPFKIYKLRSMVINAEKNGAVFAQVNDTRITPFGRFLRKSRLDEVPQLYNILRGDMSFIGPRPEREVFVEQIASVMPYYKTRHAIKPGLTGWAQVNYSYGDSIDDSLMKLQYDLFYIKHRSIFLDLNIIVKTLSTVLFYRGQ